MIRNIFRAGLLALIIVFVLLNIGLGQTPTKEFIRINGRLVAIENLSNDSAQFVPQSGDTPASVGTGATFTGRVRMKNTGAVTWTTGTYKLKQVGTNWGGPTEVALPSGQSVAPQQTAEFVITGSVAPGTANPALVYAWRMERQGTLFGPASDSMIAVTVNSNGSTFDAGQSTVPTTMISGESYAVTLRFSNSGTTTWSTNDFVVANNNGGVSWGTNQRSLSADRTPGQAESFTFNVTAPAVSSPQAIPFQW